jgi:hypothetical protein
MRGRSLLAWRPWTPGFALGQFVTSRRARITSEQAGLPACGSGRRVTGLRRDEVALLAGISVGYYTRLERGDASGVSERAHRTRRQRRPADDRQTSTSASPTHLTARWHRHSMTPST